MTPDKLATWLKEDILLRRIPLPEQRGRARCTTRATAMSTAIQQQLQREQKQEEAAALAEAQALADTLEVPLAEAAELLIDDREGYMPPAALVPAIEAPMEGSLLT